MYSEPRNFTKYYDDGRNYTYLYTPNSKSVFSLDLGLKGWIFFIVAVFGLLGNLLTAIVLRKLENRNKPINFLLLGLTIWDSGVLIKRISESLFNIIFYTAEELYSYPV